MKERCNSHPIWGTAKIIFAVPAGLTAALLLAAAQPAAAQPGWVLSHQKISDTQGGFTGILDNGDKFGYSAASLGDLDADGVGDLAVGAIWDDDGGGSRGAVCVLFLNTDGTVKSHQKISDTEGGFTGTLDDSDHFGTSVASLGDLDGDGVSDLAVGAPLDDDGGTDRGAVWVLFLNTDGTVKSHQKITGILDDGNGFAWSVASLGDLDGDGVGDLAVGAPFGDDGGSNRGAVWMLFLNTDGSVKSHQKISDTQGGFTGTLDDGDEFGSSLASLGDLDGDGVGDLAVGASHDDDGGRNHGAVWVLFLDGAASCDACDANCDGSVDLTDVEPFIELILGGEPCDACTGDTNNDGSIDLKDVEGFIACLLG